MTITAIQPLTCLYTLYAVFFCLYTLCIGYIAVRAIHRVKHIHKISLCVALFSCIIFIIKIYTSYILDARPDATLAALYGFDNKHSYPIMLFMKLLSLVKPPHIYDIMTCNMLIGSIIIYMSYAYFRLVSNNKAFGCICAVFVATNAVFWQATISSEYFLVQWIFAFTFFFAAYQVRKQNFSQKHIILFFLSYILLALSKVEMFSLLGVFFFLPLFVSRSQKSNTFFYLYYSIGALCALLSIVILLHDNGLIANVIQDTAPLRTAVHGQDLVSYMHLFTQNIRALWKRMPSLPIATIVFIGVHILRRKRTMLDFSACAICYILPLLICLFIHKEGFARQEGMIKFFCIIMPLMIYVWSVAVWNLLEAYRNTTQLFLKIGIITVCIILVGYPAKKTYHTIHAYSKTYMSAKKNNLRVWSGNPLLLSDIYTYQQHHICDLFKKYNAKLVVIDCTTFSRATTYSFVLQAWLPKHTYIPVHEETLGIGTIEEITSLLINIDVVLIISAPPSILKQLDTLLQKHASQKMLSHTMGTYSRALSLYALSDNGIEVIKRIQSYRGKDNETLSTTQKRNVCYTCLP